VAAYVIANIEVTDPKAYEEYRSRVSAIIAAYGGRYLVRGGQLEQLEGDGQFERVVVLEFPDMARLRAFYRSEDYRPLIAIRQRSARSRLIAVEGIDQVAQ
jgi:uncharacterized protein (DUF1330 family)